MRKSVQQMMRQDLQRAVSNIPEELLTEGRSFRLEWAEDGVLVSFEPQIAKNHPCILSSRT